MAQNFATERQTIGFADRLLMLLGLKTTDKQTLCADRMSALDDPATRQALADLPEHLLWDIGVISAAPDKVMKPVEGEALRRHMW
ncbi:hypothetical protein [Paracoccus laeviglucosivorans]|uniref:DUF1127 domain-containing protein n=1 Tax=Paracoccus laeviglucosivorans TaxID=1197861 RepID=A0A521F6Y6_9RHOB|nr:hypothetical protein [Paracoccus laeviglucosivorans]SMO91962.1 hypothetical protein SAMN06265221_11868 [Paracoccus laeviglucosivorans]